MLGRRYTARCVEERHGDRNNGVFHRVKNGKEKDKAEKAEEEEQAGGIMALYIVLFDAEAYGVAREFWQHTGLGVSSRFAERFLSLLELSSPSSPSSSSFASVAALEGGGGGGKKHNRHYSVNKDKKAYYHQRSPADDNHENELGADGRTYLEERYGRNLPLRVAAFAKRALRRRLAGVLIKDGLRDGDLAAGGCVGEPLLPCAVGPSSRGVKTVAEGDVYLTPSGMAAIWTAHQCLLGVGPEAKSVCFGWVLFLSFFLR